MSADSAVPSPGFVRTPDRLREYALNATQTMMSVAATGDDTGGSTSVIEEIVAPGNGPPTHIHHAADELFYVLTGQFTFQIGDQRATGGAGTVAFAPRGTAHTWMNSGGEPARILFVFVPAGFERYLMELSAVPVETLTMESMNVLGAPYQTEFVGPPLAAIPE